MTTETLNEASTAQADNSVEAPKRKMSPATRRALALTLAGTAAFTLAGCASGEGTPGSGEIKPLDKEFSVGEIMLEADLAESRQNVRELCNTGEGAAEMRDAWHRFDFYEKTGKKEWIDAFTYAADFAYSSDPQAIVHDGTYSYPTIELLAENCVDAAYLASLPAKDIWYPETAAPLLEEFHTMKNSDIDLVATRIFEINQIVQAASE